MNTWLFLFVTKENTSVEWKHPIGQRKAQVASGKVWRKDSAENIPSSEISKNTFLTPLRCITACILWILHINQNFKMYNSQVLKCGIGLFFQNTFPPEEKVDWLNLSFYDHFTRLLYRQAPRIPSGAGFVHRAVDPKLLQALFYPASHDSCWSQAPKKKYWNRSISFHTRICLYVSCP